jgi:ABC-2 type transport system ATP-binding protein
MPAIEIQQVSKSYKGVKAIDNISFNVNENEIFGLIGPDGAGKTTLFRILTTLLFPDSGQALVCGYNTFHDYKEIRKLLGYMPGRFSLYHDLTVEENLTFFATIFGTTIAENYNLIKHIYSHIEPYKNRLAGKLSGGMKQKLALSCALIHKPRVLVLDEPTTGVDAVSRKEFWQMLKDLQKNGITIIVSTPYMDEAILCNRVALIQKGSIMKIDSPTRITSEFGEQLWAIRSNNMYSLKNILTSFNDCKSAYLFGQYVHYTSKTPINTDEIKNYLKQLGHTNIEMNPIEASIEDCFMKLMVD